ncbi:FtsX-like permease family protein [Rossellomorea vietnamensis]|uniref:FtsX-like permease family protein n=1 Tax=Rossellomorea vietnamensis TaxID=218284 RepID=UPI001E4FFBAF|nr:FtsX-like permease family protein [Rossellomorea vietnamensis]MCC5801002.1 hypothetical protein [Rossellomorea vietnamensis]
MIRFIWNTWWRNKQRFILLIIGVLLLSVGLSYLVGMTQTNNGTIVNELQKRWKSSYHMVVRPPDSRSVTEDMNLLEPNYLSGLDGGITLEQYETIKGMDDVKIAAPISVMGYVFNDVQMGELNITEPGIYRLNQKETVQTGAKAEVNDGNYYFTVGGGQYSMDRAYGVGESIGELSYGTQVLVAGIDPEQEAKLVGLDNAMVDGKGSRYFSENDEVMDIPLEGNLNNISIPVILSNREFVDGEINYTVEKLDMPFDPDHQDATMEKVKKNGGEKYLEEQTGSVVEERRFTTEEAHKKIVNSVMNPSFESGLGGMSWMAFKPSPVEYKPVTSPFRERWAFSYEVEPYSLPEDSLLAVKQAYRPVESFGEDSSSWPRLRLDYIGIFDAQKLTISKDPLTELPVETYFPSKASWVLDEKGDPINPPVTMKPANNPYGFLTKPPLMLTTLDAAAHVLGDKPISAIRVNVKGVDTFNEDSEAALQKVAKEIEEETGLIVDVTLGSSPQPALTHIPGIQGEKGFGWIEQPWIKIGSSITIFKEAKLGVSGVVGSVILVAIVYVFSSNLIMMYARKKEFAVLLSLGWRPNQLSKLLLLEALLLGMVVSFISWLILAWFSVTSDLETSYIRVALIGLIGLTIYTAGALIPAYLVKKIRPYEAMRSGEISMKHKRVARSESVVGMAINSMVSRWKRTVLSVVSMGLPTGLLVFYLFITFRLKGVMYTTWLGEYVAMEVSTMHYVAMGIALSIAILTTAEIIWQNVAERQPEISVFKALGWKNGTVRMLVILEGMFSGALAGVVGLLFAFTLVWKVYGSFPFTLWWIYVAALSIPVVTGIIAAVLPAGKAANTPPYQGLNGGYSNDKKVEKQFKYILSGAAVILLLGVMTLVWKGIPEVQKGETAKVTSPVKEQGTEGKTTSVFAPEKKAEDEPQEDAPLAFLKAKELAGKQAELGEKLDLDYLTILIDSPSKTPKELKAKKKHQLITIPVSWDIKYSDPNTSNLSFKPGAYFLLDEKEKKYYPLKTDIVDALNYRGGRLKFPGRVTALLTFEVPEKYERFLISGRIPDHSKDVVAELTREDLRKSREPFTLKKTGVSPGATGDYTMKIKLDKEKNWSVETDIRVTNHSEEAFRDIGFYFIPNAFTEKNKPDFVKGHAETSIHTINSTGENLQYTLNGNKLLVDLDEKLQPGETKSISIDYSLKLPEDGLRLSQKGEDFFLAQWYPMLATYQDGWDIESFDPKGESYDTTYGNYRVSFETPEEYLVASSGEDASEEPVNKGEIEGSSIRDFYLAFLNPDDWEQKTEKVKVGMYRNVAIRAFMKKEQDSLMDDVLKKAADSFLFYHDNIGENPTGELDLIANNGDMEYSNIVEISGDPDGYEHPLIHEIAHQWFYQGVANNPYRDAWLDESLAELLSSYYLAYAYKDEGKAFAFSNQVLNTMKPEKFLNTPLNEFQRNYISTVYGKGPLLLNEFFEGNGGRTEALNFLSAYYKEYQYKHVDSDTFAQFFEEYYEGSQKEFLTGWLE